MLAQGVLGHERLELADDVRMAAQRQVRVDPRLGAGEPELLEASDLRLREHLEANVGERGATPERQRRPESLGSVGSVPALELASPLRQELLETVRIAVPGREPEPVAARLRNDDVAPDGLAKPGGDDLNGVVRICRKPVAPELLDHPIGGHALPAVNEEQGKQRPGPATRQLERAALMVERLDRPEDPKLQVPLRDSGVQAP